MKRDLGVFKMGFLFGSGSFFGICCTVAAVVGVCDIAFRKITELKKHKAEKEE